MTTAHVKTDPPPSVGWIGAGRLGSAMVRRLLESGIDVLVWNRTASRAEALRPLGACIADAMAELGTCQIVFTCVAASADLEQVVVDQVLRWPTRPSMIVDMSTVSIESSRRAREAARSRGVGFLSSPASGNASAVATGDVAFVCSGDESVFVAVQPLLGAIGRHATYVGAGDEARLVKICHNILLGVLTQSLSEVLVLAAKGGIARGQFMDFINQSVLGSKFTGYKSPAIASLDMRPTFTTLLLRKDLDLGLGEGTSRNVPLPTTALVREIVQATIAQGHGEEDFLALLLTQAQSAGLSLQPEIPDVDPRI